MNISHSGKALIALLVTALVAVVTIFYLLYSDKLTTIPPAPVNPLYRDNALSTKERVADLLSYMTETEKIGQMALIEKNSLIELDDVHRYGLGGMLSGFGGKPEDNTPVGWENMVSSFVDSSLLSRLGIPVLYGVDAIHGHSNVPGATIFPHFIGLGATGDEALVEKVARATAKELMATGVRWSYSPTYDLPEDIRWGRVYETFSDDPTLVSKLGSAYIRGLQKDSTSSSTISILATPKHYIGVGNMQWDTSTNENFTIDQGVTIADEEVLREQLLPPFQKAVDTGALSIMVGLNTWGDTKIAASSYLIQTVLKEELGFPGFVVSDWYGVYEIPGGDYKATVTAINAGVDMVMLPFAYKEFIADVQRALRRGEISPERVDDAVSRILTAKFELGLFDTTPTYSLSDIGSSQHRTLAREAVAKSQVLLKDTQNLLPLKATIKTLRVAGSSADDIGRQSGAWTVEWQGIEGNWLPGATSILAGIQAAAPSTMDIEFNKDANFATSSPKADLGIAIVGEAPYAEGWGDNPNPSLSAEDLATIQRLQAVSDRVLVILVTGRPLLITEHVDAWDALVVSWLPGSEGAGVADVLFGKRPFTGSLPLPWPARVEQLPIKNGETNDGSTPLFPRYFGLR